MTSPWTISKKWFSLRTHRYVKDYLLFVFLQSKFEANSIWIIGKWFRIEFWTITYLICWVLVFLYSVDFLKQIFIDLQTVVLVCSYFVWSVLVNPEDELFALAFHTANSINCNPEKIYHCQSWSGLKTNTYCTTDFSQA